MQKEIAKWHREMRSPDQCQLASAVPLAVPLAGRTPGPSSYSLRVDVHARAGPVTSLADDHPGSSSESHPTEPGSESSLELPGQLPRAPGARPGPGCSGSGYWY